MHTPASLEEFGVDDGRLLRAMRVWPKIDTQDTTSYLIYKHAHHLKTPSIALHIGIMDIRHTTLTVASNMLQ